MFFNFGKPASFLVNPAIQPRSVFFFQELTGEYGPEMSSCFPGPPLGAQKLFQPSGEIKIERQMRRNSCRCMMSGFPLNILNLTLV